MEREGESVGLDLKTPLYMWSQRINTKSQLQRSGKKAKCYLEVEAPCSTCAPAFPASPASVRVLFTNASIFSHLFSKGLGTSGAC